MPTLRAPGGPTSTFALEQGSLLVFPKELPKKSPGEKHHVLLPAPSESTEPWIVSWPGEYDFNGIAIHAIGQAEGKQISYLVMAEGLRTGFLSSPLRDWTEQEIEQLGDLDILVIPADDAKLVQKIVEEVDPPVVIPLRTKDEKTFQEVLRACGAKDEAPVKEVKLKKSGLPVDSRVVYVLETA